MKKVFRTRSGCKKCSNFEKVIFLLIRKERLNLILNVALFTPYCLDMDIAN